MSTGFTWQRRVEFCETDAAGIGHFASLIVYMEQAEHALLRSLGYSIFPSPSNFEADAPNVTWPRVRVDVEYHAPVFFEEILDITVQIERLGTKSIVYEHVIARGETRIATGRVTVVCCEREPKSISFGANAKPHSLKSLEIPSDLKTRLQAFVKG